MIDVARARADTPGCGDVVHLNNAGAALPTRTVLDSVIDHLELEARVGGYMAADLVTERSSAVYASVASLVGASADEIALVENATRAWDMVAYSLGASFVPGDRVLTSRAEYASNVIGLLQLSRRTGASVEVVPDDDEGQLSVDALEAMLDDRVRLVAMSWIPTQGGLVNPAAAVGAVTRAAGVPYLLDACQAAGQLPIDVDALGCDFLSATGRKYLRAPAVPGSSTCVAGGSTGSIRRSSTCMPRTGRRVTTSWCGPTPVGSRAGSARSPTSSVSAGPSTTRSSSESTTSPSA